MSAVRGLKKPLNMLETPVYPDIKRAPPRFQWSRKHWNVDVGRVLTETEHNTQFTEPAILVQSRDYNKTTYGQSSHRDVVNANFRPPLRRMEDNLPLSRLPREIAVPIINPSTADDTPVFATKNEMPSDVGAYLNDRVKAGEIRPTFFMPISAPEDSSVLPDLIAPLPSYSVSAGFNAPQSFFYDLGDLSVAKGAQEFSKLLAPLEAGYNLPQSEAGLKPTPILGFDETDYQLSTPSFSVHSGMQTQYREAAHNQLSGRMVLDQVLPAISSTAGLVYEYRPGIEEYPTPDLAYVLPVTSINAGIAPSFTVDGQGFERPAKEYQGGPRVSQTAGTAYDIALYGTTPAPGFNEKDYRQSIPSVSVHSGKKMDYQTATRDQLEGEIVLERKREAIALSSGYEAEYRPSLVDQNLELDRVLPATSQSSGFDPSFTIDVEQASLFGPTREHTRLGYSQSAGTNYSVRITPETIVNDLSYTNPQTSASSGVVMPGGTYGTPIEEIKLEYTNPQISQSSGFVSAYLSKEIVPERRLDYKTSQTSATSGYSPHFASSLPELEVSEGRTRNKIGTPTSSGIVTKYQASMIPEHTSSKTNQGRDFYSYQINPNFGYEKDNRVLPEFQRKKQAQQKYQGYVNRYSLPRPLTEQPVSLRQKVR